MEVQFHKEWSEYYFDKWIKWLPEKNWEKISECIHITTNTIEKNIDWMWNWRSLSVNPNIDISFIEKHIDKNWSWKLLSHHICITKAFVEKHMDKPWDWKYLSKYVKDIQCIPDAPIHWGALSCNPFISISYIKDNMDKPWDWTCLSGYYHCPNRLQSRWQEHSNCKSCQDFMADMTTSGWRRYSPLRPMAWFSEPLSKWSIERPVWTTNAGGLKRCLNIQDKLDHPDLPWDWRVLTFYMNIDQVVQFKDKPLNWGYLSHHMHISYIQKYPTFPWKWWVVSYNRTITIDFVVKHPEYDWHWDVLSEDIPFQDIEKHLDLPWDWEYICRNETFNMPSVYKYLDRLSIKNLSHNKHLDIEFITKYQTQLDWYLISKNIQADIIRRHPHLPWNWDAFLVNDSIDVEFIRDHPKLGKAFETKVHLRDYNPNLTMDFLKKDAKDIDLSEFDYLFRIDLNDFIRKRYQAHFMKEGGIAEEMMKILWHPSNYERFTHWE